MTECRALVLYEKKEPDIQYGIDIRFTTSIPIEQYYLEGVVIPMYELIKLMNGGNNE